MVLNNYRHLLPKFINGPVNFCAKHKITPNMISFLGFLDSVAAAVALALPNVRFLGALPKQRIAELLSGSDAGVATLLDIPLFRTVYPNKVFDYMACARPTLIAIDGVIRDLINRSQGGVFVKPQDPAALVEGVRRLLGDPEESRAMGERAHAYVTAHFDRRQAEASMSELLERVVNADPEVSTA